MVPELVASDKMLVAAFLSVVCITVVWPLQLAFWYLYDHHNMHFFVMLESIKFHSPGAYGKINLLFKLVQLTIATSSIAVPILYFIFDRPNMTHTNFGDQADPAWYAPIVIAAFASAMNLWTSCGFSVVLCSILISFVHIKECTALNKLILTDFYAYISSGNAVNDLNLLTLRVAQTSDMWSRLVLLACLSSSLCYFLLVIAYMHDRVIVWRLYPAMLIMLPALWGVGLANGAVSARIVKIYTAASIRSPILLKGVVAKNGAEKTAGDLSGLVSRTGFLKDDGEKKEAGGENQNLVGEGFDEKWEDNCDAAYEDAHRQLMESCKHLEETFGVRVFGLRITSTQDHECHDASNAIDVRNGAHVNSRQHG